MAHQKQKILTLSEWMTKSASRLQGLLNIQSEFNEDAFQDAYIALASAQKDLVGTSRDIEIAFLTHYRRFVRKTVGESMRLSHPDDLFFMMLPAYTVDEPSDTLATERKETLAQAIKMHIRATYDRNEISIWELRMSGSSFKDIADAFGISLRTVNDVVRRIAEQTRAQFAYTF